jgi:putative ABC transport system permease protein
MLAKNPGFTLAAVVTLALGIGANTTIFSLVNTVVLHPLPYPHADRLVRIDSSFGDNISLVDAAEIRRQSHSLESIGTCSFAPIPVTLTGAAMATRLEDVDISPETFTVLGVAPLFGRTFLAEETTPDRGHVVILSYSTWQKYLGSDRGAIGKTISLENQPYTIIGVMPPGFGFPSKLADVWTPMTGASPAEKKIAVASITVGRLKPGVGPHEAQAELNVIAQRLGWKSRPGENLELRVASLQEQTVGPVKKALLILFGAVGLVLLLACSNVANLLIARNARRRREIAVCAALGATRPRLLRQLLTESLLLALLGGCLGLVAALCGIHLVRVLAPPRLPRLDSVSVNGWVLAFTFVVSLLTGIVFGIFPAFAASKPDLIESLKEGSTASKAAFGPTPLRKVQGVLTACQVALATILLIGAGLVVRSLSRLMSVHLGFDPQQLLVVRLSEMDLHPLGTNATMLFYQRILDEVNALPGVESAALVKVSPIGGPGISTPVYREGESVPSGLQAFMREIQLFHAGDSHTHITQMQTVSPGYFATMRISILRGRTFTADDRYGSPPVAIVNETLARRFWPKGDAVGRKIDVGGGSGGCEVVGVADDTRDISLEKDPGPEVYRPNLQLRELEGALVVRTIVPPQRLSDAIVNRIWSADKDEVVYSVMTMDDVISKSVIGPRFHAALFSLFAFLALIMASVGVYGVVSYSVSQRTREIGIRLALGARQGDILLLVMGQQMIMTVLGVAIGLGVAFGLTRTISSLLYGVAPNDLGTFAGVPILLGLATLVASYIPARRAMRVEPTVALRYE